MEVLVGGQHGQLVPDAKLREERVDGCRLDALATAAITNVGGADVILTVGDEKRQRAEALDDPAMRFGLREALQQLLEHQTRADDGAVFQGVLQVTDFRQIRRRIPPQRQRPDTRVDEHTQSRALSAL